MNFMLLLSRVTTSALLIKVGNIFKNTKWKNWIWRGALVFKKWRGFLNPKTSFQAEKNSPFQNEEIVLVTENRFGGSPQLVRLILDSETKLKTRNRKTNLLEHNFIIGKQHGDVISLKHVPYRLQRVSMEDYVLHMKRIATPSYPKDIQAMLSMAEVRLGSIVLEAGTGSGALTLYLSHTVGKEGLVHSFDDNEKHQKKAKENISNWIISWNKTKFPHWPENVIFYNKSLRDCRDSLPSFCEVDMILLDLQSPENYLLFLIPFIKQECPIVIFLPSITQIVDVVSQCNQKNLPFTIDKVVEVDHRFWKIQPVVPVDRDIGENDGDEDSNSSKCEVQSAVKYIARPSFQQLPHTGFILKLIYRK